MSDRFLGMTKSNFFRLMVSALVVQSLLLVYVMWEARSLVNDGARSHAALCVLRNDKQRTLLQTQAYIQSDTNGEILGFPRNLWIKSEHDLQSDLRALANLDC